MGSDQRKETKSKPVMKKSRKNGRPEEITPEVVAKICEALRIGAYIESAAAYGGINKTTLYNWFKRGNREKSGPYREFLNSVEKSIEEGELYHVQNVVRHASGDKALDIKSTWQASAWMLERKFPKKWGRKEIVRTEDEDTKDSAFSEESINSILVKELDKLEDDRWED